MSGTLDTIYQAGNTIRLTCEFRDFEGELKDPSTVTVKIYNYRYEKIDEFPLSEYNQISTGQYFFDYATPMEPQYLYYEWYGELGGKPALKRGGIKTTFV